MIRTISAQNLQYTGWSHCGTLLNIDRFTKLDFISKFGTLPALRSNLGHMINRTHFGTAPQLDQEILFRIQITSLLI